METEQLESTEQSVHTESLEQLKCPNCGAPLEFKADKQLHKCDYCMSEFTQDDINQLAGLKDENAYSIPNEDEQKEFNESTTLYLCNSCGAEIITDENTAATFCYYCHSPVSIKGRLSGECRPELIIPFKYTREQAIEKYKAWCGKKWFVPKDFKSDKTLEKITGLYVPFWIADCNVNAHMNGEATKSRSHRSGDYIVTHTQVYRVARDASFEYIGIPADASKKLDDRLMDSLEPFDYSQFVPFSMSYLSGFYADKYDVSKADALPRIKERVAETSQSILRNDVVGYSSVNVQNQRTNIIRTTWHYTMLPVWFLNYKYKDKDYFFGINAQSGKVSGLLPLSIFRVAIFAIILFLVFGTLAGLFMMIAGA